MSPLAFSIVASVVLTVALNVGLRAFPGAGERIGRWVAQLGQDRPDGGVIVPWKAMIIVSVLLTVGLNLLLWIAR